MMLTSFSKECIHNFEQRWDAMMSGQRILWMAVISCVVFEDTTIIVNIARVYFEGICANCPKLENKEINESVFHVIEAMKWRLCKFVFIATPFWRYVRVPGQMATFTLGKHTFISNKTSISWHYELLLWQLLLWWSGQSVWGPGLWLWLCGFRGLGCGLEGYRYGCCRPSCYGGYGFSGFYWKWKRLVFWDLRILISHYC